MQVVSSRERLRSGWRDLLMFLLECKQQHIPHRAAPLFALQCDQWMPVFCALPAPFQNDQIFNNRNTSGLSKTDRLPSATGMICGRWRQDGAHPLK
jgi:hypothetical protein